MFDEGLKNGQGKYFWDNGDLYDGQWSNNMINGRGSFHYEKSGETYVGDWIFGKISKDFHIIDKYGKIIPQDRYEDSPLYQYLRKLQNK